MRSRGDAQAVSRSLPWGRHAQVDDRLVPSELGVQSRGGRSPEVRDRARPIGETVDGAPVAKHDGRVVGTAGGLEHPLAGEDGPLSGAPALRVVVSREPAAEDHASRLGHEPHVIGTGTGRPSRELRSSRLRVLRSAQIPAGVMGPPHEQGTHQAPPPVESETPRAAACAPTPTGRTPCEPSQLARLRRWTPGSWTCGAVTRGATWSSRPATSSPRQPTRSPLLRGRAA